MAEINSRNNLPRPLVVYFVASRAQADDALAIARQLPGTMYLVPIWPEVARYAAKQLPSFNNLKVLPFKMNRAVALLQGLRLITRFTRQPPYPVFAFGDDFNSMQIVLIKYVKKRQAKSILVQDGLFDAGDLKRLVQAFSVGKKGRRKGGSGLLNRMGLRVLECLGLVPPLQCYGLSEVTQIAAYGAASRDILIHHGVAQEKIRIAGGPRFDKLFEALLSPHPADNSGNILFVGHLLAPLGLGTQEHDLGFLAAAHNLAAARPDWRVSLRPHPADDLSLYHKFPPSASPGRVVIEREKPLVEALKESDVVVMHFYSTVLYEAMIMGKPVIFLKYEDNNLEFQNPDLNNELLIRHTSPQGLPSVIQEILAGGGMSREVLETREHFLTRELGYTDGRSAVRVAKFIQELASNP